LAVEEASEGDWVEYPLARWDAERVLWRGKELYGEFVEKVIEAIFDKGKWNGVREEEIEMQTVGTL